MNKHAKPFKRLKYIRLMKNHVKSSKLFANDEWVKSFCHDFQQHQTRYQRAIPALSCAYGRRRSIRPHQVNLIEKPIFPMANLNRKREFDSYGYYVDYQPGEHLDDPKNKNMPIDQYFEKHVVGNIIVDNSFLETHGDNAYRVLVLDGVQDYMLNYFPKVIENPHSYCKAVPSSCVVLVNMDGSYFYAMPLTHNVWLDHPQEEINSTDLGSDVKVNYHPWGLGNVSPMPIIKTTVAEIQQLLDAMPLTKTYVEDDVIYPSAKSRKQHFLVDDNGEKYQAYKYTKTMHEIYYRKNDEFVSNYYLVLTNSNYNDYDAMISSDTNQRIEYIDEYATYNMSYDYAESAGKYISKYIDNHYYKDGELYYTLDENHSNSFWDNLLKHVDTQNVNHELFGSEYTYQSCAYWSIFKKTNWMHFSDAQVEDVPLAANLTTSFEPLAKPKGLNKVLTAICPSADHTCYVNHDELIQLDRVDDLANFPVCVRRIKI